MKTTQLNLLDYIRKFQYLVDEAFTVQASNNHDTLTVGIYVKEMDERFYYSVEEIKALASKKQKIDVTIYHGLAKQLAETMNDTIDKLNARFSNPSA